MKQTHQEVYPPRKLVTQWPSSKKDKSCNYPECLVQFKQVKQITMSKNIKSEDYQLIGEKTTL